MAQKKSTIRHQDVKPLYKIVKPKTVGQANYCKALKENTITFGIGPAGSGKTYLAVASAIE